LFFFTLFLDGDAIHLHNKITGQSRPYIGHWLPFGWLWVKNIFFGVFTLDGEEEME
jgi:hypothetical protein